MKFHRNSTIPLRVWMIFKTRFCEIIFEHFYNDEIASMGCDGEWVGSQQIIQHSETHLGWSDEGLSAGFVRRHLCVSSTRCISTAIVQSPEKSIEITVGGDDGGDIDLLFWLRIDLKFDGWEGIGRRWKALDEFN